MDFVPNFTWSDSGEIVLKPTPDAQAYARQVKARSKLIGGVKGPTRVIQDAKLRVQHGQGDAEDSNLLLSQYDLQFGTYRGQTFNWLLSNDMGYTIMIVAAHLKERQAGSDNMNRTMLNKDSLCRYAKLFPEIMRAVEQRMVSDGSQIPVSSSALDSKLVGFGQHAKLTYKDFYESSVAGVQSYRNWLSKNPARSAGSMLDQLRKYVLWRDEQETKASTSVSANPSSVMPANAPSSSLLPPRPATKKRKRIAVIESSSDDDDAVADVADGAPIMSAVEEVERSILPSLTPPTPAPLPPMPTPCPAAPTVPRAAQTPPSAAVIRRTAVVPFMDVCLPEPWKTTLPPGQHAWLSRALFTRDSNGKAVLNSELQLWYHPPGPQHIYYQPPTSPEAFFQQPFFLWMPYRMWHCPIKCPVCQHKMTSCGIYRTVRRVLDREGWYYMGTEYLECRHCGKKLASWSLSILGQLAQEYQLQFPAVLTYRLACDRRVLSQMSGRTLGNSATRLYTFLREQHTKAWMARCILYMKVYLQFLMPHVERPPPATYPKMDPIPGPQWLLAAYGNLCYGQIEEMQAGITSVHGSILKMDSTKKITKKLAGHAAGMAGWMTNVGNEHGQILMSVLTVAEGSGLKAMAQGLMHRYQQAGVEPPKVLYVDRDCCCTSQNGRSAAGRMFSDWSTLQVRLDIWHFMRRLAGVVTSDSHPLYCNFIRRISSAIFVWDPEDVALLKRAKEASVPGSWSTVSLREMARHCRRATRGTEMTERYLDAVLDAFKDATDTMGVPLLDVDRVEPIWATQCRHVRCIQDPPHVSLYTQTGQVTMGGICLPLYRCARGSTSLKSFHLHLNRFIPGTSANDIHFQLYLLEGLTRWNADRSRACVPRGSQDPHLCYSPNEIQQANQLSVELFGQQMLDTYSNPPLPYTGELIGVSYLFAQTGQVLEDIPDNKEGPQDEQQGDEEGEWEEEQDLDEGFQELMFDLEALTGNPLLQPPEPQRPEAQPQTEEVYVSVDGTPGYQHVIQLAERLLQLRLVTCVSQRQADDIVQLWERLPERDKAPIIFPPRFRDQLSHGRFKKQKSSRAPTDSRAGVESLSRCLNSQGCGPAQSPDLSRLVEAICILLCKLFPQNRTFAGARITRWTDIIRNYTCIRENVLSHPTLFTKIQLFEINPKTLTQWFNKRRARQENVVLSVGQMDNIPPLRGDPQPAARRMAVPASSVRVHTPHTVTSASLAATASATSAALAEVAASAAAAPSAATPAASAPPAIVLPKPLPPPLAALPMVERQWQRLPKTTAWYRKQLQMKKEKAEQEGRVYIAKADFSCTCRLCKQPKTKQYGHSRFYSKKRKTMMHFCQATGGGETAEEWLSKRKREEDQL